MNKKSLNLFKNILLIVGGIILLLFALAEGGQRNSAIVESEPTPTPFSELKNTFELGEGESDNILAEATPTEIPTPTINPTPSYARFSNQDIHDNYKYYSTRKGLSEWALHVLLVEKDDEKFNNIMKYFYFLYPIYFHGYQCESDCSGHEAGYEWAEENDISDIDDCTGNSDSFIEGCYAYVEENY